MTLDDINRMAHDCPYTSEELRGAFYEGFIQGAAAERDACARVCDELSLGFHSPHEYREDCAAAIRARGQA